jgi:hypothetical protein
MSLPGIGTPCRASGKSSNKWRLEWTYSDTGGVPVLDTAQSDRHPDIPIPLTDAGTGRTGVRFPKGLRAWVEHLSATPVTPGTAANNVRPIPVSIDADAGTMEVQFVAANGATAPIDPPEAGTRVRLTLEIEAP